MKLCFQSCDVSRNRLLFRVLAPLAGLALLSLSAAAQTTSNCTTAGTIANQVAVEGLAEKIGDVVITCAGGSSGSLVIASLFVGLNTNITNRLDTSGNLQNITLTSTGAVVTADPVTITSSTALKFTNVSYTVPALNSTPVIIRISGIRAAVGTISNGVSPVFVNASVVGIGVNMSGGQQVLVAAGFTSLLSSTLNNGIPCNGSQFPVTTDFTGFLSTTSSAVRITEANATAFAVKDPAGDTGTRILVKMSGYGAGVRLFVPDALVGNSGSGPTSAGHFASSIASGTYVPAANQLLLSRVNGADANGNGGTLVLTPPVPASTFTGVSELTVSSGSAYAVYEVLDSSIYIQESVQVPVFIVTPPNNCASSPQTALSASIAPVSSVSIATVTDPIPRYIVTALGSDCHQVGDCGSNYFPVLSVDTTPLSLTAASLGSAAMGAILVSNNGGAQLNFTVTVAYQSGSNWLTVTPATGANNVSLTARADPSQLQPGTYNATVTVNGGAAGSATVQVTFTVGPPGVTIQAVVNAASFQAGGVTPGSYVALFGVNLAGTNVVVKFNGLAGNVAYDSAGQINVIIPSGLAGQAGASVIATIDGKVSNSFNIVLAANAPGVFNPGIVNPDGSVNSVSRPANRGGIIQVYLTGLAIPVSGLTVNMGAQTGIIPLFAGAQPTFAGLDQVNVTIPASLAVTGGSVPLSVCVPASSGSAVCSNSVSLFVQ